MEFWRGTGIKIGVRLERYYGGVHGFSSQGPDSLTEDSNCGPGFVGSTTAYALLMSGMPAEIVLVDRDRRRAEGHAHDLRDAEGFTCSGRISVGDVCDCCSADVTIITAGVSQAGLKSRLDDLTQTAPIVKGLVQDVAGSNPHGILLIASNPVDVLTYAAWKWSGLPASRLSHPFVERLIGTLRREYLDRTLFWTTADLENKLLDFKTYFNNHRRHQSLEGRTPETPRSRPVANLHSFRWQPHCRSLYQTPMAA